VLCTVAAIRRQAEREESVAGGRNIMRLTVYDELKHRLFVGELRSGQFVSQRELTELLGATLNPVREAIRKLEGEGLINVFAQRGIQIVEADPKAINDACDYRLLLETEALRRFASDAPKEQIAGLRNNVEAVLKELKRDPNSREVRVKALDEDYKFHRDLIDAQQNEIISKHYRLNAARLRLFRINTGEPLARLELAAAEHLEILDACRTRSPDRAAKLLAQHIQISREHTLGIRPMRWKGEVPTLTRR
jgi:DNA-binding GntR family transcriptional regulator